MAYGIGSLILALLFVVMLSLASHGQNNRQRAKSTTFQHVTAQVDTLHHFANQNTAYRVLVFHPSTRTDFADLEKSIQGLGVSGKVEIALEYYPWGKPETTILARDLKIRISPQTTLVVFEAPNSAITWGGPDDKISLAKTGLVFPSPRMCEIIKSAQNGGDVLLVFSHDDAANSKTLVQTATAYAKNPVNQAELFVIDPDDASNLDIVERTGLPPDSLKDARLLFMVGGRVRGQLTGEITDLDIQGLKKSCSGKAGCC